MIEVPYWKDKDFRNWYGDKVLNLILEKRRKIKNNEQFHVLVNAMNNLSNDDIKAILCCSREELEENDWIREYLKLADCVGEYNEFREDCVSNRYKLPELKRLRKKYIEKYNGRIKLKFSKFLYGKSKCKISWPLFLYFIKNEEKDIKEDNYKLENKVEIKFEDIKQNGDNINDKKIIVT